MLTLEDVNLLLQELAEEARLEAIDDLYNKLEDEYLCRMVAEVTMDDVGCEFDPKIA